MILKGFFHYIAFATLMCARSLECALVLHNSL